MMFRSVSFLFLISGKEKALALALELALALASASALALARLEEECHTADATRQSAEPGWRKNYVDVGMRALTERRSAFA